MAKNIATKKTSIDISDKMRALLTEMHKLEFQYGCELDIAVARLDRAQDEITELNGEIEKLQKRCDSLSKKIELQKKSETKK